MRMSLFGLLTAWVAGLMLTASPARADWLRAETDHFVIYGDVSETTIRRYAQKVERFDALLRRYYPIPVENEIPKLEIFIADGLADMRQVTPGLGRNVGGFYSPNSGRITAVVNQNSSMGDEVLFHEYAHHFMFQMASAAYPSWFVEGFAEFYSTARVADRLEIGRFNEGRMMALSYATNPWPPTEDVLSWRVSPSGRFRGADYYAQSWALTHYMMSDPERTRALGRYLGAVSQGDDPVAAMQTVIGRTPQQLQADLRGHISGTVPTWAPQIELPTPDVEISRLSPAEAQLVWMDLRLDRMSPEREREEEDETETETETKETPEQRAEREAERADFLRRAMAAAARYPDDPMALMVKARAQRLSNDPSAALATLEPLLSGESPDARALLIAGVSALEVAQTQSENASKAETTRTARGYLARALEADALDFRTYLALDDSRKEAAGYPTANDLSTLQVAATLAPQSFDARTRTAAALMAHDRPIEAVAMLTPVANSPHGGSRMTAVKEALARARAAAGLQPVAIGTAPPDQPVEDEATSPG